MYDAVILGATGFTGRWVVEEMRQTAPEVKFAVAGRSLDKLKEIADESQCIVCNVESEDEIVNMCKQTRLLINCCGPYRLLGEQVFSKCVENGVDYIDLCGEPAFIEEMEVKYSQKAKETGCIAVCGCGFDSIPSEMGVVFLQHHFEENMLRLKNVEAFLQFPQVHSSYSGHSTTWDCAVMGFAHQDELRNIRLKLDLAKIDIKPIKRKVLQKVDNIPGVNGRIIPFPGSDSSIVRRSQSSLVKLGSSTKPIRFNIYCVIQSHFGLFLLLIGGIWFMLLTKFKFGQQLLMQFSEIFSFGWFTRHGPPKSAIKGTKFSITFKAYGEEDLGNKVEKFALVSGPEPGYAATSRIMVACARTMLQERPNICNAIKEQGGVYTSATAFRQTSLISNLCARGIKFQMLE